MAQAPKSPKFQYIEWLFDKYLEPLEIIDYFRGTRCFEHVGMNIHFVKGCDDGARKERARIFCEWLEKESNDSPIIFKELLDVLQQVENYKWMVPILGDDFADDFFPCLEKVVKADHLKDIIQALMLQMQAVINPDEIAEHMRRYLTSEDREEIENIVRTKSNSCGVYSLLHKLIYKKPGWIQYFIQAIRDLGYDSLDTDMTLAELLEDYCNCFCLEKEEEPMVVEEHGAQSLKSSCTEHLNISKMELSQIPKEVSVGAPDETDQEQFSQSMERNACGQVLRNYQNELSKKALLGENVVICAPTNSGKTTVAANIIDKHLTGGPENPKVVFFVPTGGLAKQQFNKLKMYLIRHQKKIALLHGEMEDRFDKNHGKIVYSHDVIVMTPQILLNCLQNKTVHSVHDFSLFIFDECHHTRASDPYCEIMRICLGLHSPMRIVPLSDSRGLDCGLFVDPQPKHSKKSTEDSKRIQIVGLTATLGIGSAEDEKQAKDNIFMLLGMMDASGGLSMITDPKNLDELNKYCPSAPEKRVLIKAKDDKFKMSLREAIVCILECLEEFPGFEQMKISSPNAVDECMKGELEMWCHKLRGVAEGHLDKKTDNDIITTLGRDIKSASDTILELIKVQRMAANCHPADAMNKLAEFSQKLFVHLNEKNTEFENKIHVIIENALDKLQDCVKETENEMLTVMIKAIQDKEHEDKDFRCMVMVSRRLYAECLRNFVERSPLLKHLGCMMYIGVGTKSSSDTHGMTHAKQEKAVEAFEKGDCKVLICTPDAAGEGIDIANCNLVITVECINDEIKLVQLKGRARKIDVSEVVHIHFQKSDDQRDVLPYKKELMMRKVTKQIHKMNTRDNKAYLFQLKAGRSMALSKIEEAKMKKSGTRPKYRNSSDTLNCRKCSTPVCNLSQIVKINGSHHTVDNCNFQSMFSTQSHRESGDEIRRTGMTHVNRISCGNCKQDWGNQVEWKGRLVPILTVKGFKIVEGKKKSEKVHRPSKWATTGLNVPTLNSGLNDFLDKLPLRSGEDNLNGVCLADY